MGSLFAFFLLAAAWPAIRWEPWISSGLENPVDIQSPRDGSGRLFVVEQRGRLRLIRNGALAATPVLDIVSKVQYGGEMGLLGLAFPPDFARKQYFYLNYIDRQRRTIVARYKITGDTADPASEEVLLTIPQPFDNHNGGCLQFSPRDGQLYIGMGDGGSAGDPRKFAQNPATFLGKMLRFDVENGAGTPQIWASGLRNPWRYSFDRATADLFIADVGQGALEEIDFQPANAVAGLNYGWSLMEGTRCFDDRNCAARSDLVRPVFEYGRSDGVSVTGGYVYRGQRFPFLTGIYVFGDYGSGQIWGMRRDGAKWEAQKLVNTGLPIVSFGEDEAGEQYLVAHNGRILRLAADPPPPAVNAVVSAASFAPGIAPGGIATAFLNALPGLNGVVAADRLPLPETLSGVTVRLNGTPAPLFAVASSGIGAQVNFLIPGTTPAGDVTVNINGAETRATVAAAAPAVFTFDGRTAATRGTGLRGEPLEIYATGLGRPIAETSVTIGGRPATVLFAGPAPGFAGLDQINVLVPADASPGDQELIVHTRGFTSPPVRIPVR
jgi:uncharacterized protein (TIGR03437 family)